MEKPEDLSTRAPRFKAGDTKAYCIAHEGGRLFTEDVAYVVAECVDLDGASGELFTSTQVEAMAPGDELTAPHWQVTCHMVDAEWLANLPEHDGW